VDNDKEEDGRNACAVTIADKNTAKDRKFVMVSGSVLSVLSSYNITSGACILHDLAEKMDTWKGDEKYSACDVQCVSLGKWRRCQGDAYTWR
jgi:hypothetical protein